ncbi:hypothetical protein Godav_025910, partial [Gossypium davidsonii]|nr:hypothetical protein [Gossypium davidsonii]
MMVVLNDSKLDLGKHLAVVFKENANLNNGEALGDDIIDNSGKFFLFSKLGVQVIKAIRARMLINAQLDMEMYKGLKALKGKHTLGSGNSKNIPWVTIGDFNAMLSSSNKKGGHKVRKDCLLFKDFIEMANLQDLGFKGPDFMWHRDDLYEISNDAWTPSQISGYWVEHPSFPNFVKEKWCLKELQEAAFTCPVHTSTTQRPMMAKKDCLQLPVLCAAEPLFTPKDLSHCFFAICE